MGCREGIPVDQSMPRCPPLDLAKACEIASSKVAITVLEFPQR